MAGHLGLTAANGSALTASGAPVVVIGPSGWIGSAALAMLEQAFSADELANRLLVFGSHARKITLPSGRAIACAALDRLGAADISGSPILHFGYLTKDKTHAVDDDAYIAANEAIQAHVLRAVETSAPSGLFFASSGGVYQGREPGKPTRGDNLYGWMKLRHEAQFAAAAEDAGVALVNGRIFTIAGEYVNKVDLYALASILVALREERPIRLTASVEVWRSYTYVGDVINFALAMLLKRQSGTLDIAGERPIEIGDLALLCREVTGKGHLAIERPPLTAGATNSMIGDHADYHRLLAREGIRPLALEAQIAATAAYLGIH